MCCAVASLDPCWAQAVRPLPLVQREEVPSPRLPPKGAVCPKPCAVLTGSFPVLSSLAHTPAKAQMDGLRRGTRATRSGGLSPALCVISLVLRCGRRLWGYTCSQDPRSQDPIAEGSSAHGKPIWAGSQWLLPGPGSSCRVEGPACSILHNHSSIHSF